MCFHLYYLHLCISLYTCANVICIKLLLTYLLTYFLLISDRFVRCNDMWQQLTCETDKTNGSAVSEPFSYFPSSKVYYTLISVVMFFLPVTVMTLAYAVIICRLWTHHTPGESAGGTRWAVAGHRSTLNVADEAAQVNVKKVIRPSCNLRMTLERITRTMRGDLPCFLRQSTSRRG